MSTLRKVTYNSVWLLAANIITKIIGAFTTVIIARYLGDSGLGQYSFAIAFVGFFGILTNFGFDTLLIRESSKNKKQAQKLAGNILSIKTILSLITIAILIVLMFFIDKPYIVKILIIIFAFDLVLNALKNIFADVLQGYELIKYTAISNIIEKALWAFALIFILRYDLGMTGIAVGTVIATIIGTVYLYIMYKKYVSKMTFLYDKRMYKKLFIEAWPFALTGIFVLIYWKIDLVMLSFYTNDAVVGWYSAPYRLLEILMIVPVIIMTALYPVFSRLAKNNKPKLLITFKAAIRYLMIFMIPTTIGTVLLSKVIIGTIYGSQFSNSIIALKLLIFATFFAFANYPMLSLLNATGDQKRATYQTGVSAALNLLLNFIFIPLLSYIGAAITTIIAEGAFFLMSYIYISRKGYDINFLSLITKPLIAGIIMGAFIYFFMDLNIYLLVAFSACIYVLMIFLLREITAEDISMAKSIVKRK